MNYALLNQLLARAEEFEREQPLQTEQELLTFVAWLNQKLAPTAQLSVSDAGLRTAGDRSETVESVLATLLIFLNRYARGYVGKALVGSPLANADDFAYLVTLLTFGSQTKTELLTRMIHEKTSGMEVIKRLIANGLVSQRADPTDRRSQRVDLTEAGREALLAAFPAMYQATTLVGGNLSGEEKFQLLYLLRKLDAFHNDLFLHARAEPLPVLLAKLPPGENR